MGLRLNYRQQESTWAYVFILPAILGYLLFVIFPLVFGFWTSLTDWDAFTPPEFIGFLNYKRLFTITEPHWYPDTVMNTLFFVFMVPVSIAIQLLLAVLVNLDLRLAKTFRAVFFLPTITSAAIMAMIWLWLYDTNFGLINWLLGYIGIAPVPWLQSEKYAKLAIWIMGIWNGAGFGMMVNLSALQGISQEVIEASKIDGASPSRRFFAIILPLLTPVLFFQLVTSAIGAFQTFTTILMTTRGAQDTMTAVYYIYNYAFSQSEWGFATAGAYVLALLVMLLTVIQFVGQRRWVFYGG